MIASQYSQLSDKELVELHIKGDRYAFQYIFKKYYAHLWSVAIRHTYSIQDAEDCLQEAILKAHKVIENFRWQCNLSSWLHRIVVNTCIDRIRSNQKSPIPLADYRPVESYIHQAEDKETILTVREALRRLTTEHREIIQLVDIEGFSIKEVSEMLNLPIGTVKSRTGRARAKLLEFMTLDD